MTILFLGTPDPVISTWPAEALRARGHDVRVVDPTYVDRPGDTIVCSIGALVNKDAHVTELQRRGFRVVLMEFDDNLHLPSAVIAGRPAGEEWRRHFPAAHRRAVQAADGIIVTSAALLRQMPVRKTRLVRPSLPRWIGETPRETQVQTIGWMGAIASHRIDLDWLRPAVPRLSRLGPLHTVGDREVPAYLGWPGLAYPWEPDHGRLYSRMARADVGIVPLAPHRFNRSKSWLKALEFATLGVPVVASATPENRALASRIPGIRLVSGPHQMAEVLAALLDLDPAERRRTGEEMARDAARISLERVGVEDWEKALDLS